MFFEYPQCIFRIRRIQVAGQLHVVTRFFREKRSHCKVKVTELVHAGFDRLQRIHPFGHMTDHSHPKPVSFLSDYFQDIGLDVIANLDLLETGIFVMLHRGARFRGRARLDVERVKIVFAINVTSQKQSRSEAASLLRRIAKRSAKLNVIANVTRGRDASSQVSWSKLDLIKVRMHIPQAWQDILATKIYYSLFRGTL